MGKRAAVVIGVDKTGKLTPLKSAASGAARVGEWLRGEPDFEVTLLTDGNGPVRARDVEDAIHKFVKPPTIYELLVVYFSGHGYWQNRADQWLLSEAPERPNEAINLKGAVDLAKVCGIPNVVFVSDACRSLPQDLASAFINGSDGFPIFDGLPSGKVDVFRATSAARPAYEVPIGTSVGSVLTVALESAYQDPPAEIVREIEADGSTVRIVPNRLLEDFLQDRVDEILADIDINLVQAIEADVPSGDNVYIARVRMPAMAGMPPPPPGPLAPPSQPPAASALPPDDSDEETPAEPPPSPGPPRRYRRRRMRVPAVVAAEALQEALAPRRRKSVLENQHVPEAVRDALGEEIAEKMPGGPVGHFESQTGFSVVGATVTEALCSTRSGLGGNAELLEPGGQELGPAIVRVWTQPPGATTAIRFADGRSILLPALYGYIGHAAVTKEGLANVSYVPSDNSSRWDRYQERREKLDLLRAKVAVAANHGALTLSSPVEAERLGDEIREDNEFDPTLGLYAAYGYSQAGKESSVGSVLEYMRADLGADLFDVHMLAFRSPPPADPFPLLPFCPLLTQGWNLLRARRMEMAPVLADAAAHLTGSLWTTFRPEFTKKLFKAIERGDV